VIPKNKLKRTAKKELLLCYAKTRFIFGDYQQSIPSRFLKELPEEIKEIAAGFDDSFFGGYSSFEPKQNYNSQQKLAKKSFDQSQTLFGKRMFHQKFGYGKVVSVDGSKLEIEFEKSGKKTVMKDFVSLC